MPQVDFYILHTQSRKYQDYLVCQLVDKAWRQQGYRIYIQTQSLEVARRLDMLLWTFKEDRFLPHDIYPDVDSIAPIRIGYTANYVNLEVLINMTATIPPWNAEFQRIAEIVDDTPTARQAGRTRYCFYRDHHYDLRLHDIHY